MKFLYFITLFFLILPIVFACEDGETRSCPNEEGECTKGYQECIGESWTVCSVLPIDEICEDNLDNDCDGVIDENCLCTEGATEKCGTDTGICEFGTRTCTNNNWTGCISTSNPLNEICNNNADDDCDGLVDYQDSDCTNTICFNRQKDNLEDGIDCGGPCSKTCPTCSDGILNQDEIKTNIVINTLGNRSDCGGPNCILCPTCIDGIQNQNEEGIDCGSICQKSCNIAPLIIEDDSPTCGDNICENDEIDCPEDCGSYAKSFIYLILFVILIPIFLLIVYILFKKSKKQKKKIVPKVHYSLLKEQPSKKQPDPISEELKKIK